MSELDYLLGQGDGLEDRKDLKEALMALTRALEATSDWPALSRGMPYNDSEGFVKHIGYFYSMYHMYKKVYINRHYIVPKSKYKYKLS